MPCHDLSKTVSQHCNIATLQHCNIAGPESFRFYYFQRDYLLRGVPLPLVHLKGGPVLTHDATSTQKGAGRRLIAGPERHAMMSLKLTANIATLQTLQHNNTAGPE